MTPPFAAMAADVVGMATKLGGLEEEVAAVVAVDGDAGAATAGLSATRGAAGGAGTTTGSDREGPTDGDADSGSMFLKGKTHSSKTT